jgi:hypothetical protein
VTLYLYPLAQSLGFQQMRVEDLLSEPSAPGGTNPRTELVINPGEQREVSDTFPPTTTLIGIVVDYYREPGVPGGTAKVMVEPECGWGQPKIHLTPHSVLRD